MHFSVDKTSVSMDFKGGGPQPLDLDSTRNVCRAFLEIYEQFTITFDNKQIVFLNWLNHKYILHINYGTLIITVWHVKTMSCNHLLIILWSGIEPIMERIIC